MNYDVIATEPQKITEGAPELGWCFQELFHTEAGRLDLFTPAFPRYHWEVMPSLGEATSFEQLLPRAIAGQRLSYKLIFIHILTLPAAGGMSILLQQKICIGGTTHDI